jgi:hypothetical protein
MSSGSPMKRTQVYLTEAEYDALKAVSARTGVSFAATLREAVDAYLARQQGFGIREAIAASYGCRQTDSDEELDERALRQEWGRRESRYE